MCTYICICLVHTHLSMTNATVCHPLTRYVMQALHFSTVRWRTRWPPYLSWRPTAASPPSEAPNTKAHTAFPLTCSIVCSLCESNLPIIDATVTHYTLSAILGTICMRSKMAAIVAAVRIHASRCQQFCNGSNFCGCPHTRVKMSAVPLTVRMRGRIPAVSGVVPGMFVDIGRIQHMACLSTCVVVSPGGSTRRDSS